MIAVSNKISVKDQLSNSLHEDALNSVDQEGKIDDYFLSISESSVNDL